MPDRNQPIGRVGRKILLKPSVHSPVNRQTCLKGIQAEDMDVSVIDAVVSLRSRCHATAFCIGWEGKDIIVGPSLSGTVGTISLVVAVAGEPGGLAKYFRIDIEHSLLKLFIRSRHICIVAQHEHEIGILASVKVSVGGVNSFGIIVCRPRIAQHPDTTRSFCPFYRSRLEKIISPGCENIGSVIHLIKILSICRKAG